MILGLAHGCIQCVKLLIHGWYMITICLRCGQYTIDMWLIYDIGHVATILR